MNMHPVHVSAKIKYSRDSSIISCMHSECGRTQRTLNFVPQKGEMQRKISKRLKSKKNRIVRSIIMISIHVWFGIFERAHHIAI
jgi:hypothetical protein